jgi:hypothetical protein
MVLKLFKLIALFTFINEHVHFDYRHGAYMNLIKMIYLLFIKLKIQSSWTKKMISLIKMIKSDLNKWDILC